MNVVPATRDGHARGASRENDNLSAGRGRAIHKPPVCDRYLDKEVYLLINESSVAEHSYDR